MTRFADELRGAEGEHCVVQGHPGIVTSVSDGGACAAVRFGDGTSAVFDYSVIELTGCDDAS